MVSEIALSTQQRPVVEVQGDRCSSGTGVTQPFIYCSTFHYYISGQTTECTNFFFLKTTRCFGRMLHFLVSLTDGCTDLSTQATLLCRQGCLLRWP